MAYPAVKRVGVAVLDSDTSLEPELAMAFTGSIPIHVARIDYPGTVTPETLELAREASLHAMRQLTRTEPDLLVYACTSGSFFGGAGSNADYRGLVRLETGVPVTTASDAAVHSLRRLGARRIGLVTPYTRTITARLIELLDESGVEVVSTSLLFGDAVVDDVTLQGIGVDAVATACRDVGGDVDAVLVSCTGIRALHAIDRLETASGAAVVTSNAAIARFILDAAPDAKTTLPGRLLGLTRIPPDLSDRG